MSDMLYGIVMTALVIILPVMAYARGRIDERRLIENERRETKVWPRVKAGIRRGVTRTVQYINTVREHV